MIGEWQQKNRLTNTGDNISQMIELQTKIYGYIALLSVFLTAVLGHPLT